MRMTTTMTTIACARKIEEALYFLIFFFTDCVELSCEFWFWAHVLFLLTDGVLLLGSTITVTSGGGGGSCRFLALDFCFLFLVIAGREWEALMKPMLLLV